MEIGKHILSRPRRRTEEDGHKKAQKAQENLRFVLFVLFCGYAKRVLSCGLVSMTLRRFTCWVIFLAWLNGLAGAAQAAVVYVGTSQIRPPPPPREFRG